VCESESERGTVQELVDEDEVLADVLLVELAAKVGPEDEDELVEEGEDEGAVDVLLGGGEQVDVAASHVEQRGAADARDGRPHFLGVDHLQPKRVRHAATDNTEKCTHR
jgi:hypothetical protein